MVKIKNNPFLISLLIHLAIALIITLLLYKKNIKPKIYTSKRIPVSLKNIITDKNSVSLKRITPKKIPIKKGKNIKQNSIKNSLLVKKVKNIKYKKLISKKRKKFKSLDKKRVDDIFGNLGKIEKSNHKYYSKNVANYLKKNQPTQKAQSIRQLYGAEFLKYNSQQRKFIKDNIDKIAIITQRVLNMRGYPIDAIKFSEYGVNVAEFNFHPDGSIDNLVIIYSSGHKSLDKNSLDTIKAAYKDYPYPTTTTVIRILVRYSFNY